MPQPLDTSKLRKGDLIFLSRYHAEQETPGRPAVVVSDLVHNETSTNLFVAYLTADRTVEKTDYTIPTQLNGRPSWIMMERMNSVTKDRVMAAAGHVEPHTIDAMDAALQLAFSL